MNIITSSIDYILNLGMSNGLSALLFGTSCCAKSLQEADFYNSGFGECKIHTLNARAKEADLLIITGFINVKLAPQLEKLYNEMPKPAYVMLLGDCACGCGIFSGKDDKNVDIDAFLPVDIRLKGCPVKEIDFICALKELQTKIKNTYIKEQKEAPKIDTEAVLDNTDTLKTPKDNELEVQKV